MIEKYSEDLASLLKIANEQNNKINLSLILITNSFSKLIFVSSNNSNSEFLVACSILNLISLSFCIKFNTLSVYK